MRKYKVRIFIIIFALLLICMISYSYINQGRTKDDSKKISVIVHGDNTQRWENFRQGVEQAAMDLNAEITFLTMEDDTSVPEQEGLIEREIKNKAQGLIVAAADSAGMTESIREAMKHIPVVTVETDVRAEDESTLEYISADNKKMGEELAETIMRENDKTVPVYVVQVNQQRDSVLERQEGLVSGLQANGYSVTFWQPGEGDIKLSLFISKMQKTYESGIVAALDETTLESVIDGIEEYVYSDKESEEGDREQRKENKQIPAIYGIGSTAKIVYYLDRDFIRGIVFQDEYHVGYTSIVRIFRQVKDGKRPQADAGRIEFYSADKDTLHLQENERLLYPIIQ